MKLFEKMKHYNFWVALSMAFLLLLNTVARAFNIEIDNDLYNDIVMAVLGVVTVLGFVQKDGFAFTNTDANADTDKTDNTTIDKAKLSVMSAKRDNVENSTIAEQIENADTDKVADANNTAQPAPNEYPAPNEQPATHTVGKAE